MIEKSTQDHHLIMRTPIVLGSVYSPTPNPQVQQKLGLSFSIATAQVLVLCKDSGSTFCASVKKTCGYDYFMANVIHTKCSQKHALAKYTPKPYLLRSAPTF